MHRCRAGSGGAFHRVRVNQVQKSTVTRAATVGGSGAAAHGPAGKPIARNRYTRGMNTPDSVVGCSSCGALYTPGPGDSGVCLDCRRRAAAAQPRPPSGNTIRPNSPQPARIAAMRPPLGASVRRRNPALRRNLIRVGVAAALAAGLGALFVTQRQRITSTWTSVQRHGISREWTTVQRKVWEAWVAIRRDTPWPVVEDKRSASRGGTATRGTHRHPQVAATSKRKRKKGRDDINNPGSTP